MADRRLKTALKRALLDRSSAAEILKNIVENDVVSVEEAELVVRVLKLFPLEPGALGTILGWMQRTEDDGAMEVFKHAGVVELLRIFDATLVELSIDAANVARKNELMFILKVVALYAGEGGQERLVSCARTPSMRDAYLWAVVQNVVSSDRHPWRLAVVDQLRDPLPDGFAGVAYLDLANAVARAPGLERHPFDTPVGLTKLTAWLSGADDSPSSYAVSATSSIPFLRPESRRAIQELADAHPVPEVQLEAAWAAARCGEERGFRSLEKAASDPVRATRAQEYLRELNAAERIPLLSRTPDFQALSEMCSWLAHPSEFGRPPGAIQQADTRELFWPPTGDRRRVWLFRYEYEPLDGETEKDIGYGMVGSVTFALFGETTADKTIEEVYGLHCAWELEVKEDPRAPEKRTAEAGIAILAKHNKNFSAVR